MTKTEYKNELKEIKERLEKLEAANIEEPQTKRWKPEIGDEYWAHSINGVVSNLNWRNDVVDKWNYLIGNCFKTEDEAEEYKKKIEYTAQYKNYIEDHNEPIDWENRMQKKFAVYYDCDTKTIGVEQIKTFKDQGTIYASSEEIIHEAIAEIGEHNFRKYVLEVK